MSFHKHCLSLQLIEDNYKSEKFNQGVLIGNFVYQFREWNNLAIGRTSHPRRFEFDGRESFESPWAMAMGHVRVYIHMHIITFPEGGVLIARFCDLSAMVCQLRALSVEFPRVNHLTSNMCTGLFEGLIKHSNDSNKPALEYIVVVEPLSNNRGN